MRHFGYLATRVLHKAHLLGYANLRVRVPIRGKMVVLPINGTAGIENLRLSEPWLLRAFEAVVGWKPGAFLDVGMNVGQTLLKYVAAGGGGPYYGFDPNATAVAYVKHLIRLNQLAWAHVVPVGLSDRTGCARLHLSSDIDSTASIVGGFRPDSFYKRNEIAVVFRGDDIIAALEPGPISIIKIDVEGGELEVLQGLEATIQAHRPIIFCEILPIYDPRSELGRSRRSRTDTVEALLRSRDYQIIRLLHDGRMQDLNGVETHGNRQLCEYVFHPAEAAQIIRSRLHEPVAR
jgi:FkbM family methyltransferase